jgi:hypothetical protein
LGGGADDAEQQQNRSFQQDAQQADYSCC